MPPSKATATRIPAQQGTTSTRKQTAMQWHKYVYEIWPDPMPVATYPILVPDHAVLYVREGISAWDVSPDVPSGFRATPASHVRSQCVRAQHKLYK